MAQIRPVMIDGVRFCIEPPDGHKIDDVDAFMFDLSNGEFDVDEFHYNEYPDYHLVTFHVGEDTIYEIELYCEEVLSDHLMEVSDE
jgi:hypothetical protein